ncbi:MAG: tetratricopeptide repeat protein, partial [Planctomycetota bacterium]
MRALLAPLIGLWRRRPERAGELVGAPRREATVVRRLCQDLDEALRIVHGPRAARLARAASRLCADHPRLTERVARVHMMRDEPREAMSIIDRCRRNSSSLRLLRAVALVETGRRTEALRDLRLWDRRSSAPVRARILLADLEWHDGDTGAATRALQRNLRQVDDPTSIALLLTMSIIEERPTATRRWAERLRHSTAWGITSSMHEIMLESLGVRWTPQSGHATDRHVQTLADELVGCQQTIDPLAEALGRSGARDTGELLTRAVARALPQLAAPSAAMEAVARMLL